MRFLILFIFACQFSFCTVEVGLDRFFQEDYIGIIRGKRIGLITNHTAINKTAKSSIDVFKENEKFFHYKLVALFAPEHGIEGSEYAANEVKTKKRSCGLPIYSLHGKTRRPTEEMLKDIDVLIYDIQDIGVRSYTYASTLFFAMEEAAKFNIQIIILDRPNPINGLTVDGPMLESQWRSFVGYINVPYCHGMTIGELAKFFNEEYKIQCKLKIIPMKGWQRTMSFLETGLTWIPLSPAIPEASTPFYYASTGILGELGCVNIGVGYTLPFKVVGADWIDAKVFAEKLNMQKLPGVTFIPFHYKPFFGSFKNKECHGVMIIIDDLKVYKPLSVQYALLGILKSLYPKEVTAKLEGLSASQKKIFCQVNGTEQVLKILKEEKYSMWKLLDFHNNERKNFIKIREKYLLKEYN